MSLRPSRPHETQDQVGGRSALQICCQRTPSQHKQKQCIWYV